VVAIIGWMVDCWKVSEDGEVIAAAWSDGTADHRALASGGGCDAFEPWSSQRASCTGVICVKILIFCDSLAPGDEKTRAFCSLVMHAC
jgi:hypothetical protein